MLGSEFERIFKGCLKIKLQEELDQYFTDNLDALNSNSEEEKGFDFLGFLVGNGASDLGYTDSIILTCVQSYLRACKKKGVIQIYKDLGYHPVILMDNRSDTIKEAMYEAFSGLGPKKDRVKILSEAFQASDISAHFNIEEWLNLRKKGEQIELSSEQESALYNLTKDNHNLPVENIACIINGCPSIRSEALKHFSTWFKDKDIGNAEIRKKLLFLWKSDAWLSISYEQELQFVRLIKNEVITEEKEIVLIFKHCTRVRDEITSLKPKYVGDDRGQIIQDVVVNSLLAEINKGNANLAAVFESFEKEGIGWHHLLEQLAFSGSNRRLAITKITEYMLERDENAFHGIGNWVRLWSSNEDYSFLLDIIFKKNKAFANLPCALEKVIYFSCAHKGFYHNYYKKPIKVYLAANLIKTVLGVWLLRKTYSLASCISFKWYNRAWVAYVVIGLLLDKKTTIRDVNVGKTSVFIELKHASWAIALLYLTLLSGSNTFAEVYMPLGDVLYSAIAGDLSEALGIGKFIVYRLFAMIAGKVLDHFNILKLSPWLALPEIGMFDIGAISMLLLPAATSYIAGSTLKYGVYAGEALRSVISSGINTIDRVVEVISIYDRKINHGLLYTSALALCYYTKDSEFAYPILGLSAPVFVALCSYTMFKHDQLEKEYKREYMIK